MQTKNKKAKFLFGQQGKPKIESRKGKKRKRAKLFLAFCSISNNKS
jgi:hypothetical protein